MNGLPPTSTWLQLQFLPRARTSRFTFFGEEQKQWGDRENKNALAWVSAPRGTLSERFPVRKSTQGLRTVCLIKPELAPPWSHRRPTCMSPTAGPKIKPTHLSGEGWWHIGTTIA
jgi:hypothetical protein